MTTVAICDDNDIQRDIMTELLDEFSSTHKELKVTVFSSGRELLDHVHTGGGFDVYILDIIMPDVNGMELAGTLRLMKDPGKIIFTTATLEYAAVSYDVQAFYYLVKPIDPQKFFRVMDNALSAAEANADSVEVKTRQGVIKLRTRDVTFVEINERTLRYYLKDGRTCDSLALRGSFREAIDPLMRDSAFALCGVSKAVNLRYVDAVDSEVVLLKDGTMIYPPRSAYTEFRRAWVDYRR